MNGMVAIARKELRSYFYSPVAYVITGVFLAITGVIFTKFVYIYYAYNQSQRFGQQQGITLDKLVNFLYQNAAFILCFLTPMITMRLFAEERRQQTLELLLTAPIRSSELVLGKFFAGFAMMLVVLATSLTYAAFMMAWGSPEVPVIVSTYIGLALSIACYIALGGLISACTASQAIAAVFTFIVLILLWLLQSLGQGMTAKWGPIEWGPTLSYISPLGHFSSFAEGLIHIKDVVYFISFTAFILFLTHRVVESNRWR